MARGCCCRTPKIVADLKLKLDLWLPNPLNHPVVLPVRPVRCPNQLFNILPTAKLLPLPFLEQLVQRGLS